MKAAAATATVLAGLLVVGLVQVAPAGASPHTRPKPAGVGRSQRKRSSVTDAVPAAAVSNPPAPLAHRPRLVHHAPVSAAGHPRSAVSSRPRQAVATPGRSVTRSRPETPKDAGTARLKRAARVTTAKTKVRSVRAVAARRDQDEDQDEHHDEKQG